MQNKQGRHTNSQFIAAVGDFPASVVHLKKKV